VIAERIRTLLHTDAPPVSDHRTPASVPTTLPAPRAGRLGRLARAFHRPLRSASAALALAGALLAAATCGPAFARLGTGQGLAFLAVAVTGIGLAVAVLRGARWALASATVLLGGQVGGVIGTGWELTGGIAISKADMIRQLGFSPTAGVLINLVYSTVAVALFYWLAWRWLQLGRGPGPGADDSA
jgi:hypothetical protein